MKITIESDLPGEKYPPLVYTRIRDVGVFGYDIVGRPFNKTIGDPIVLYDRCCGLKRFLGTVMEKLDDGCFND